MWRVDDFEKKNDHYTVLLNYLSYACQRLVMFYNLSLALHCSLSFLTYRITVKANPLTSVTIVNTINDTHIEKVHNEIIYFLNSFLPILFNSVLLYFFLPELSRNECLQCICFRVKC